MSLQRARTDYQQAANDTALEADASADLFAAEKLLQQAENSWQEDHDSAETDHLSYLADRKTDLARATASQAASKRAFDELSAKKDEICLKARETEIEKLKAKKVPQGILVTLGDVLFEMARSSPKPGSLEKIYPLVEYLNAHPEIIEKIEGHTYSRGPKDYNIDLSQSRAESIGNFLISNGIAPARITTLAMGKDHPVAINSTVAGCQQNRRVEATITDVPVTKPHVFSGKGRL
jgi:OmpA-OmpF porin, OOP family